MRDDQALIGSFEKVYDTVLPRLAEIIGLNPGELSSLPKKFMVQDKGEYPLSAAGLLYGSKLPERPIQISDNFLEIESGQLHMTERCIEELKKAGKISVTNVCNAQELHRITILSHEVVHSIHHQFQGDAFTKVADKYHKLPIKLDKTHVGVLEEIAWVEGIAEALSLCVEAKLIEISVKDLWSVRKSFEGKTGGYVIYAIGRDYFFEQNIDNFLPLLKSKIPSFAGKYIPTRIRTNLQEICS